MIDDIQLEEAVDYVIDDTFTFDGYQVVRRAFQVLCKQKKLI